MMQVLISRPIMGRPSALDTQPTGGVGRQEMYQDTEVFVDAEFERQVRIAAYHLWEDEGRPEGREKDFWFIALDKLLSERGDRGTASHEAANDTH